MKKKLLLAFGLVVTAVALYFALRPVYWPDFFKALKGFDAWWLIPSMALFYFSIYLRSVRWGLLFRPHHQLSGWRLMRPLMICFAFNSIFPARVGEFARAFYVGKRERTGITTAFATVLAERILDGLTLLIMLAISLWTLPRLDPSLKVDLWGKSVDAGQLNYYMRQLVIGSIVLTAGVIIFMIPLTQRILAWMVRRVPLPARHQESMVNLLHRFAMGFHALHQPKVLIQIIFHSAVLWVLCAVSNVVLARGFGMEMNLAQGAAIVTLVGIFILIPAAPGYWGLFELGVIFSLIVLGVVQPDQQELALAYAIVLHLIQWVPLVIIGLLFAWQDQMRPDLPAEIETRAVEPAPAARQ